MVVFMPKRWALDKPNDSQRLGVGHRLRVARHNAGLTLEEVGEALGIVRQSVSKWEAGETYPTGERLRRIAVLYNVSLDWLMTEDKPKQIAESAAFYAIGEPPATEAEAKLMREFLRYIRRQRNQQTEQEETELR